MKMGVLSIRSSFVSFALVFIALPSLLFTLTIAESQVGDETHFDYKEGSQYGPKEWSNLNPDWQICGTGKLQSPIDLLHAKAQVDPNLGELKRDYKPAPAVLKNRGHNIAVFWKGDAGQINIKGTDYKLIQCHWHSPTEHSIDASRYNLELHMVHTSSNGETAVVGILYEYGQPDPLLTKLLEYIKVIGKEEKDVGVIDPGIINFRSIEYFRYIGSFTTPPCTEGVTWTISDKVSTVSREQVEALRQAVDDGYEDDARPTQPSDGRPLWLYTPKR